MRKVLRVILAGRFQPFHSGHLAVYNHLCNKFGKDVVFIATSNKQGPSSPLSYKQKKHIINKGFKVQINHIVHCKVPYVPDEILNKTDKDKTVSIICLGIKDKDRLVKNKHYEILPEVYEIDKLKTSDQVSYIYFSPMFEKNISATSIRMRFLDINTPNEQKKDLFIKMFGFFNENIFFTLTHNTK